MQSKTQNGATEEMTEECEIIYPKTLRINEMHDREIRMIAADIGSNKQVVGSAALEIGLKNPEQIETFVRPNERK